MICDQCHQKVVKSNYIALIHWPIINGEPTMKRVCRECRTPGFTTEGITTRQSFRIRTQRDENEADFVQPHAYDRNTRKEILNPDFIKLYPDKLRYYAKPGEVAKAGYTKLGEAMEATAKEEKKVKDKVYKSVEFTGSAKEGIKKVLEKK